MLVVSVLLLRCHSCWWLVLPLVLLPLVLRPLVVLLLVTTEIRVDGVRPQRARRP